VTREDVLAAGSFDAFCALVICTGALVIAFGCIAICVHLCRREKYDPAFGFGVVGCGILLLMAMLFPMLGDVFSVWYAPNYYIERFESRWSNARMTIEEPPHAK